MLGFAEVGVLLGRKTFLIDQVDPTERTTHVAFANTAMGVVTLLFGFLGIPAQVYGIGTLTVILILLGLTGAIASYFLPKSRTDAPIRPAVFHFKSAPGLRCVCITFVKSPIHSSMVL